MGGGVGALLAAIRLHEIPPKGDSRWVEVMRELNGDTPGMVLAPQLPNPSPPPRYPPHAEVASLWNAAIPLESLPRTHPALAYLENSRGLDVHRLGIFDLVRILPLSYGWPDWISPVIPRFYPLVIPVYDNTGLLRSLRFRALQPPDKAPKALPPRGYDLKGLIFADSLGLGVLRGVEEVEGIQWDRRVVIAEGEPDFLSFAIDEKRCTQAAQRRRTHAVLGVVAGSWSAELASRIPAGSTVAIWTHFDEAGNRYAETIQKTLAGRCDVRRPLPPGSPP